MEFIEILGLGAGICTSSAAIPQLVKTIKEKKAEQISPFMFIIMFTGNALWVYYGFNKSDLPIISTNILSLALDTAMLVLKFKYKDNK
jgi:MtN3 and saliva related transmembrane protein